ncbi:MAG: short-subunit dehydrogenase [Paracoccaceae bacterium]
MDVVITARAVPVPATRHVLITGASSGLGAALAEAYAASGVRLSLAGRNKERLSAVGAACSALGSETATSVFDVTNAEAARDWVQGAAALAPLDLVVANAGISAGTGSGGKTAAQARQILAINVDGVANTVLPAIGQMQPRGHGQIAIMSSIAGFVGFPGAPAYCASKAAVRVWGESLRGELAGSGVLVSVICPGFIRTPMTDRNPFPMPFLTDPKKAARIIVARLAQNRARIVFPWPLYAAVRTLGALPAGLRDRLLRAAPRKP